MYASTEHLVFAEAAPSKHNRHAERGRESGLVNTCAHTRTSTHMYRRWRGDEVGGMDQETRDRATTVSDS